MNTSISLLILAATVLASLAAFSDGRLFERLLFDPYRVRVHKEWYRSLTHALVHADLPHLAVNMFVLHAFGANVEFLFERLSPLPVWLTFGGLYLGGAFVGAMPAYFKHASRSGYRSVGASGAVSAVTFAVILLLPMAPLRILFLPVDLPAVVFGALYLVYSWAMDRRGGDGVAHDAHLHGALFGVAYTALLEPQALFHFGSLQNFLQP
jgi:membrane associated rhomboid family serine protease